MRYQAFRNATELLDAVGKERFTLYLLDVMMPGTSGMAAAREIRGFDDAAAIAGGWENRRQKWLILALCPLFLLIQTPCWLILGEGVTKQLYPLIVHLPLVLILILALKKPVGIALVSVCTAYLCCQLPGGLIWQSPPLPALPWWVRSATRWRSIPYFCSCAAILCGPHTVP